MRLRDSLSVAGLLLGTLFFAASLTPSLVPRPPLVQGIVSGISLAGGYAAGVFGQWLWHFLELPVAHGRAGTIIKRALAVVCVITAAAFLWQASAWQNSVRLLMEMPPVETARPFTVGLVALLLFGVLLAIARLFGVTFLLIARGLKRFVPRRIAYVVGVLAAAAVFWSIIDGVLFSLALRAADSAARQSDALIESDVDPPAEPVRSGSPASLLAWDEIGRAGRAFIASGPTREQLEAFHAGSALEPIRVYVGLNSADTVEERARLALEELQRAGAFERSVLVLVTPTGTGWIDPGAIDTLEYLHRGDLASVAVQYSYLPSVLSLLIEPDYGVETARALFAEVYEHWTELPEDARPDLFLHGLSLGALNSDLSFDIFDVVGDPFQGALWSGPPYRSETWRSVTARREPGTPAWLPRFRDSSIIRFTNQENQLNIPGTRWGPMRIVYLQYASDPVTFFDPRAFYREPEWMAEPRGPDVSPALRWYPFVTLLQLAADLAAGEVAPPGYGHDYAPEHYIDAWLAVTAPAGWTRDEVARLKALYAQ